MQYQVLLCQVGKVSDGDLRCQLGVEVQKYDALLITDEGK